MNEVSVDACVRSTEFGKLSHVRKIIHSYIQNDKVRVSGGYMSILVYNERIIKGRGGLVVESLTRDRGVEPHRRHYVCPWARHVNSYLVLVQPRKTGNFLTVLSSR